MEYDPSANADRIAEKVGAEVVTSQGYARSSRDYIDRVDALASGMYESVQ